MNELENALASECINEIFTLSEKLSTDWSKDKKYSRLFLARLKAEIAALEKVAPQLA